LTRSSYVGTTIETDIFSSFIYVDRDADRAVARDATARRCVSHVRWR